MKTLREICLASKRLDLLDTNQFATFKKELGASEINGFEDYFLFLISKKIKTKNKANSIIAYIVGLTDVKPQNPVNYKGGSIPDIDIDIADNRRSEVRDYLLGKYGEDHVAGIATFNVFMAKAAIEYTGKALGYDLDFINTIKKLVPPPEQGKNWHINEAMERSPELQRYYDSNKNVKEVIDWASKIDGLYNSNSSHAAGYVVSSEPINTLSSTSRNEKNDWFPVLEFNMNEAEALGYVKFDLLGLRTLTVIDDAVKLINQRHHINIIADDIPIDDPVIFEIFHKGLSQGIFQLEKKDIAGFAQTFCPKNLEDITVISAGYRPGPMEFLMEILKIKNGGQSKIIPHGEKFPIIKDILKPTYGFFLFQEQIQKVVQLLAGYTEHEADEFRKIIGKKLHAKMAIEKDRFVPKALEKGMSRKDVEELWDQMEGFASYSFNLSHALAYSVITVQTAWIKYYYSAEFYAANIINDINNQAKVTAFIEEAKKMGIKILPPDINESMTDFAIISNSTLRFGLGGIASVGVNTADDIISEREQNGHYRSVSDFIYRASPRSNVLEHMIKAGCFDSMVQRRAMFNVVKDKETYIQQLTEMIHYFKGKSWVPLSFENEWIDIDPVIEYSKSELAEMEKQTTGLYLSYHPIEGYRDIIDNMRKKDDILVGTISDIQIFKYDKGGKLTLQTIDGDVSGLLFFGKSWQKIKHKFSDMKTKIVAVARYKKTNSINETDNDFVVYDYTILSDSHKCVDLYEITVPLNISSLKKTKQMLDKNADKKGILNITLQGERFRAEAAINI